jgi:ribosomal protein L23
MVFIVDKAATKADIKTAIENQFSTKVVKVNVMNGPDGKKKAYVKFSPETPAIELATNLGMM